MSNTTDLTDAHWMARCLQLAAHGALTAAPNPMVGALLVQGDRVLAEGWHQRPGEGHAEVRCLEAFGPGPVPSDAVLYVNLEPCSHHGRTPPCVDLVIARDIRTVVAAHEDPFGVVAGTGIARLRAAGVDVRVGVMEAEARWLNRRFITSICEARPYVVLKWARSQDGLLDRLPRAERSGTPISGPYGQVLVHRWRAEEQAILVGGRTVLNDDPELTVRLVHGAPPLRVVLDRSGIAPAGSKVFSRSPPTLLVNAIHRNDVLVEQVTLQMNIEPLPGLLHILHQRGIRSVLVEGGARLLNAFLEQGLWDEARVITGPVMLGKGTAAPTLPHPPSRSAMFDRDRIDLHYRTSAPPDPASSSF